MEIQKYRCSNAILRSKVYYKISKCDVVVKFDFWKELDLKNCVVNLHKLLCTNLKMFELLSPLNR